MAAGRDHGDGVVNATLATVLITLILAAVVTWITMWLELGALAGRLDALERRPPGR